jgi:hypothetical protein
MPPCTWDSIAPKPTCDASVLKIKAKLVSGKGKTGGLLNLPFRLSKAS